MNSRFLRNGIVMLVLVVGAAALLYSVFVPSTSQKPIDYAGSPESFLGLVKQGKVDRVVQQGAKLEITLNSPSGQVVTSQVPSEFSTDVRADIDRDLPGLDLRYGPE